MTIFKEMDWQYQNNVSPEKSRYNCRVRKFFKTCSAIYECNFCVCFDTISFDIICLHIDTSKVLGY